MRYALLSIVFLSACGDDPPAAPPDASGGDYGTRVGDGGGVPERDAGSDPIEDAGGRPDVMLPAAGCERSRLQDVAEALAPGQVMELETAGLTTELHFDGSANTVFGYGFEAFWDANTCQVLFIGGGHLSLTKFIVYNASENEWFRAPDPDYFCPIRRGDEVAWNCVSHAYGNDAYDPETGTFFYVYDGAVRAIEVTPSIGSAWRRVGDWPEGQTSYTSMEYFVEMDRLIIVDSALLHVIDPTSGARTTIDGPFPMGAYHFYGVYNPVHGVMLFGSGNGSSAMNVLEADGSVRAASDAPRSFHPEPDGADTFKIMTFDPASGDYLAYARNGDLFRYDVAGDAWSEVAVEMPEGADVAAAITSYGVVLFVDVNSNRVFVYKH
jgi:hypothetical protein